MKKKSDIIAIGIAGLIGSGKSEALKFFRNKNIPTVDLDLESRKLIKKDAPCYKKIIKKFGTGILNKNSTINRKKLREIIVNNKTKRKELNKIVHPELLAKVKAICKTNSIQGKRIIVFEGALISTETKLGNLLDKIIFIDAPKEVLVKRIKKRDVLDEQLVIKLLDMQKDIKKNRNTADFIIDNDETLGKLKRQLRVILDKLSH